MAARPCSTATSTTTPGNHDRQRASELRDALPGESGHAVSCSAAGAVPSFTTSQRRQQTPPTWPGPSVSGTPAIGLAGHASRSATIRSVKDTLALRLATERDHDVIVRLIDAAAEWPPAEGVRFLVAPPGG
jgi:hypothetical protein